MNLRLKQEDQEASSHVKRFYSCMWLITLSLLLPSSAPAGLSGPNLNNCTPPPPSETAQMLALTQLMGT